MLTTDLENKNVDDGSLTFNSSWGPEDEAWDDEEDDDFEDRLEDLDDLHEIQVQEEEEFEEPAEDDDDHLPDDE
jgi:hypothetical protein